MSDEGDSTNPEHRSELAEKLVRLRAHPAWFRIRKALMADAVKSKVPLRRLEDTVNQGLLECIEEHGDDIDRLGGEKAFEALAGPAVLKVHERVRKQKGTRALPLTARFLAELREPGDDPEQAVSREQTRASWERFLARVRELAAPFPCAHLILAAMGEGENSTAAARAAGFSDDQIFYERRHIKRLAEIAAREPKFVPRRGTDAQEETP
jgi:hypothetical protein